MDGLASYVETETQGGSKFSRLRDVVADIWAQVQPADDEQLGEDMAVFRTTLTKMLAEPITCDWATGFDERCVYRDVVELIDRRMVDESIDRINDIERAPKLRDAIGEWKDEGERIIKDAKEWFADDVRILSNTRRWLAELGAGASSAPNSSAFSMR